MRATLRTIGIVAVAFLVVAQFARIDRTNPPVEADIPAPTNVKVALRAACYDCHSNQTVWPWYSHVAPMSWLLAYDVLEGREELNFSTWQRYDAGKQQKKLKKSVEEMNEGEMPPWFYTMMHPPARLADADRQAIISWASAGSTNVSSSGE